MTIIIRRLFVRNLKKFHRKYVIICVILFVIWLCWLMFGVRTYDRMFIVHSHTSYSLNIVTVVSSIPQFNAVRRLVGSVHLWQPNTHMLVYTYGVTHEIVSELKLWRNVAVVECVGEMRTFKPIVTDALGRVESAMFVDPHVTLLAPLYEIDERLSSERSSMFLSVPLLGERRRGSDAAGGASKEMYPDVFGLHQSSQHAWRARPQMSMLDFHNSRSCDALLVAAAVLSVEDKTVSSIQNEVDLMAIIFLWKSRMYQQYVTTKRALYAVLNNAELSRSGIVPKPVAHVAKQHAMSDAIDIDTMIAKVVSEGEYEMVDGDFVMPRISSSGGSVDSSTTTTISVRVLGDNEIVELRVDGVDHTEELPNRDDYLKGDTIDVTVKGDNHVVGIEIFDTGGDVGVMLEVVDSKERVLLKTGDDSADIRFTADAPEDAFLGTWSAVNFDDSAWVDSADTGPNCKVQKLIERANTVAKHGATHVWPGGCRESKTTRRWMRARFTTSSSLSEKKVKSSPSVSSVPVLNGTRIVRRVVVGRSIEVRNERVVLESSAFPIQRQSQYIRYGEPVYLRTVSGATLNYDDATESVQSLTVGGGLHSAFRFVSVGDSYSTNDLIRYSSDSVSLSALRSSPIVLVRTKDDVLVMDSVLSGAQAFTLEVMTKPAGERVFVKSGDIVSLRALGNALDVADDRFRLTAEGAQFQLVRAINYTDYIVYRDDDEASLSGHEIEHHHEGHHNLKKSQVDADVPLSGTITVALLVAMIANSANVAECHFFKYFVPSIVKTIKSASQQANDELKFEYVVYVGVDKGDPMFDTPQGRKQLSEIFEEKTKGFPIRLEVHSFKTPKGNPVRVWNGVADKAYHDGAHYLYQLNDDTTFVDKGWTEEFVNRLRKSNDVGVTGPIEAKFQSDVRIIPQAFVSRKHLDIFPTFYPSVFHNWFSDDWLDKVYSKRRFVTRKRIRNENPSGTSRYTIDWKGETLLKGELVKGYRLVHKYLNSDTQ